jgi:hypothetical protein
MKGHKTITQQNFLDKPIEIQIFPSYYKNSLDTMKKQSSGYYLLFSDYIYMDQIQRKLKERIFEGKNNKIANYTWIQHEDLL